MDKTFFAGRTACCFTGHRPDAMPKEGTPAETALKLKLMEALDLALESGVTAFHNGGARGFDLMCGEAVLALKADHPGLKLFLYPASPHHTDGWSARDAERFGRLAANAESVEYAAAMNYPYAYLARNRRLVDRSDCCVCYLKKPSGGTLYTVNYAMDRGIPVMNLYTADASQQ